ncbi:MAG: hypothetical protein U1E76_06825 [Planctomycetota bacterium]
MDRAHHRQWQIAWLLIAALATGLALAWWALDAGDADGRAPAPLASAEATAPARAPSGDGPAASRPAIAPAAARDQAPERLAIADLPDLPTEPVPFRVWGEVVDASGAGVDQFTVTLRDPAADRFSSAPVAQSKAQRSYSLLAGRLGSFRLQCDAAGFLSQDVGVELTDDARHAHVAFQLASAPEVRVRFLTSSGERLLASSPAGFPAAELAAVATRFSPRARVTQGELCGQSENAAPALLRFDRSTDLAARRTWRAAAEDCVLELNELPPVYVSAVIGDTVIATEPMPAFVEAIDLRIDPLRFAERLATVTLRVLDADSSLPITDLLVTSTPPGSEAEVILRAPVGADGVAMLTHLVPGRHLVQVRASGHEHWRGGVRVGAGERLDLGTLLLGKAVEVSGAVVGSNGQPINHFIVGVIAHVDRSGVTPSLEWQSAVSRQAGAFTVPYLGRGVHDLVVSSPPWALTVSRVDTTLGPVRDLRIALVPGMEVTFRLTSAPLSSASVGVAEPGGSDFVSFDARRGAARHHVQLAPGDYLAHLYDQEGGLLFTTPFRVRDAALAVDLGRTP